MKILLSKTTKMTAFFYSLVLMPVWVNAQVCNGSLPESTPTSHFVDNGDGTVTDNHTGLSWKKCSEGQTYNGGSCVGKATLYNWGEALSQTAAVNGGGGFAGHTDWRVPELPELRSIVEKRCQVPSINLTVFPNVGPSEWFWSSSPLAYVGGDETAWSVGFFYGYDIWSFKKYDYQVRLVRSL